MSNDVHAQVLPCSAALRFWPMRPAMTHMVTITKLESICKIPADYEKIDTKGLERVIDLIVDGTDLTREGVEKLGWPEILQLITAVQDFNTIRTPK